MTKTAPPIPNKYAEFLLDKPILELDPDGFHYVRHIQGLPHRKIMFGFPKLNAEDIQELEILGLSIKNLPKKFGITND